MNLIQRIQQVHQITGAPPTTVNATQAELDQLAAGATLRPTLGGDGHIRVMGCIVRVLPPEQDLPWRSRYVDDAWRAAWADAQTGFDPWYSGNRSTWR